MSFEPQGFGHQFNMDLAEFKENLLA